MKRRLLLGFTVLVLAFSALPALADSADPVGDAALAAIFAPASAPDLGVSPQPQDAAKRPGITPKSTCVANCWDGSTRTCSGTTCSATNSNCAAGQQGSCTAGGSTSFCPVCPSTTCTATTTCSPSGSVSCTGTNGDCFSVNKCYVECNGVIKFCPVHGNCPL